MYDWMEEVLLECVNRIAEAKLGVLCNTTVALEENVLQVLHSRIRKGESTHHNRFFRMIGPLVTNAAAEHKASRASFWQEERDECMEWLDKQPPASVVYVAFGSLKVLTLPQLHEVLLGLIASSHRFLMVVRPNTVVSESYGMSDIYWEAQDGDVVPLEKALPPGFSSPDQQRLYKIVSWAPQTWVLEHPSVGGFFSHCGWNSTLESLWCGVPILGWPWIMDQVTNCWLLSSVWNVGISLQCNERGEASRNEVESGVRQLMGGAATDKLRAQAREIKDKIREAALHNQEITSLVEEIGSVSRFNP
ncbi:hypothetical protein KP509_01G081900 [Ceratopteris richardii]|nr:hypothetical protein KP509_01G081900 [Ceratopteris richardii]